MKQASMLDFVAPSIKEHRKRLGITQEELSRMAEVPYTTIIKLERGAIKNPSIGVLSKIARALSISLDDFTAVETFTGKDAVRRIWSDILESLNPGEEMLISGIDERNYLEADRKGIVKFIADLKKRGLSQKLLSCEGDTFGFEGDHLEYRWIPEEFFSPTPIYVYGDKLATLVWGPPQRAMITLNPEVAEAYRRQFLCLWKSVAKKKR